MERQVGGCTPAASVLGVGHASCSECPFPFCVVAEAETIKCELRKHSVRIMRGLGESVDEIARAMGITTRSVHRYTRTCGDCSSVECTQCNMARSRGVVCRSDTYTVAREGEQYIVVLNRHRRATPQELKTVECFIGYVFPYSAVNRGTDNHDCWTLSGVGSEEIKSFEQMCAALDRYTLSMSRSMKCLQQVR